MFIFKIVFSGNFFSKISIFCVNFRKSQYFLYIFENLQIFLCLFSKQDFQEKCLNILCIFVSKISIFQEKMRRTHIRCYFYSTNGRYISRFNAFGATWSCIMDGSIIECDISAVTKMELQCTYTDLLDNDLRNKESFLEIYFVKQIGTSKTFILFYGLNLRCNYFLLRLPEGPTVRFTITVKIKYLSLFDLEYYCHIIDFV